MANDLELKKGNNLIHRLFYWSYSQGYMLSKAKLSAVLVFIFLVVLWAFAGAPLIFIPLSVLFSGITFLIGYAFHIAFSKPPAAKIRNNDYGFFKDLVNLLFFWQDNDGNYTLSKTKLISALVFIAMFFVGLSAPAGISLFAGIMFGVIFEIPVFAIGTAAHKYISNRTPQKLPDKQEKPKTVEKVKEISQKTAVIPEYLQYQMQLDELNAEFTKKEKATRIIIENRFQPPQLTYTRFISGVDKSAELFNKNIESAFTMIHLAVEYSPRIAGEVESRIDILKGIIDKMDKLSNELVLNDDLTKDDDVEDLINQMDNLIKSVKDYDQ